MKILCSKFHKDPNCFLCDLRNAFAMDVVIQFFFSFKLNNDWCVVHLGKFCWESFDFIVQNGHYWFQSNRFLGHKHGCKYLIMHVCPFKMWTFHITSWVIIITQWSYEGQFMLCGINFFLHMTKFKLWRIIKTIVMNFFINNFVWMALKGVPKLFCIYWTCLCTCQMVKH